MSVTLGVVLAALVAPACLALVLLMDRLERSLDGRPQPVEPGTLALPADGRGRDDTGRSDGTTNR